MCSQFGEMLQSGEVLYAGDVVVLHKQMGEVGGEVEVADVCDMVIIQVKDSQVSTHGNVTLKIGVKKVRHTVEEKHLV